MKLKRKRSSDHISDFKAFFTLPIPFPFPITDVPPLKKKCKNNTMTLPGLSLPGLGTSSTPSNPGAGISSLPPGQPQESRTETLNPRTEWRFEVSFGQQYHIRLTRGYAELFGVELAANQLYTFSGCKGAIFTWQGCELEISGNAESEYAGLETDYAIEWLNVHGMLETARDMALINGNASEGGPRVLVVGPDFVGKSSLVRSLAGWSVKCGRTPTVVNIDPREGLLAPPGSFTAVTVGSQLDVETGYGISPMTGPTTTTIKSPVVYHCPYSTPAEKPEVYKALLTRTALSVTNKLEEDALAKQSGLIIDTPGALNDPKSSYDIINHIISEFSITLILTIGSERLYNDLNRRFGAGKPNSDETAIPVLRIAKPGGAVERDAAFMKALQNSQIRQYFFGTSREPLNPHSHTYSFAELSVYRANSPSLTKTSSFNDVGMTSDDDDDYNPSSSQKTNSTADFEKFTPSNEMLGRLVAIKYCPSGSDEATVRDSAVMGFVYVSEVDEAKKRVRFLAPHPQRWGERALVWGGWVEAVPDLVS